MRPGAIIFDFDGVLLDSEFESNRRLAGLLSELGSPVSLEDALTQFIGISGESFFAAIEQRIGRPLPHAFHGRLAEENAAMVDAGIEAVDGAVEFVRALDPAIPKAVASSSSSSWIASHLDRLGIRACFGPHLYSGREHVRNGKPAPDLYIYAAQQIGRPIEACVIIEDSEVGARGALASGARVIGLSAGRHCLTDHGDRLRALGVREIAHSFDEVAGLLELG